MRRASGCSKMAVDDLGTFLCRHSLEINISKVICPSCHLQILPSHRHLSLTSSHRFPFCLLSSNDKIYAEHILSQAHAIRPLTTPAAPMRYQSSSLFQFIPDTILSWSWLDWLSLEKSAPLNTLHQAQVIQWWSSTACIPSHTCSAYHFCHWIILVPDWALPAWG